MLLPPFSHVAQGGRGETRRENGTSGSFDTQYNGVYSEDMAGILAIRKFVTKSMGREFKQAEVKLDGIAKALLAGVKLELDMNRGINRTRV